MSRRTVNLIKARFPLGEFVRATRFFSPGACAMHCMTNYHKSSNVLGDIRKRRKKYSWSASINSRTRTLNSPFVLRSSYTFLTQNLFLYFSRCRLFRNSNNVSNFRLKNHRLFKTAIFVFLFCYFRINFVCSRSGDWPLLWKL